MRIQIAAVGRLKDGPERELMARYLDRFEGAGRPLALGPATVAELAEGRAQDRASRMADEAQRLLKATEGAQVRIVLDERGKSLTSEAFAKLLAQRRDGGTAALALMIGGPDGHGEAVRAAATVTLSLGTMTLPHGLARVILAEQLYRAATILAGHPYHRA